MCIADYELSIESIMIDEKKKRIVVVTGFGPFEGVVENPSSLIVEQLHRLSTDEFDDIELIGEILPVVYDVVADSVDEIWRRHEPLVCL